jgi:hypothetical protein
MLCHNIEQMVRKSRKSLYLDENGNTIQGRYIYHVDNGKFHAQLKYPEGYSKSKSCYSLEEAIAFVRDEYDTYAPGWYYDTDMRMVFLRRPGDPRPKRMF